LIFSPKFKPKEGSRRVDILTPSDHNKRIIFSKEFQRDMKKRTFPSQSFICLIVLVSFLGCASKGIKTTEGDPGTLYREGLTRFNKRDYSEARTRFEQLKSNFPDNPPFTTWAELKIGDCHFFMKEYVEAIAAYEEFKKIHPTHEEMPYVQYQIGMSYYNQMLSLDRDQTFTKKALSAFEYLVANYPPGLFTQKAKEKIEICRKQLADHEFYIGDYYYRHEKFEAASYRFKGLVEKFPKMPDEDKTLFLLGKSYLELDEREKAKEIFNKMVKEYPGSPYFEEAKKILEQSSDEKKVPVSRKESENRESEPGVMPLVRFEDERRRSVPFNSPLPVIRNPVRSNPHPKPEIKVEVQGEEEKRKEAPPIHSNPSGEKEKRKQESSRDSGHGKLADASQPIDITSDRVETYSKKNLVIFKGNVIARQKDVVIYADLLEAVMMGEGKGIEKVTATGNVKIQQGLRVASCQKAVFYNLDQKVVLTGEPKVQEGDDMVSGDEIIFDLTQNRFEVKGGANGRGKARIRPREGLERGK
jgi:outer membrane protein assembly factor BamD